MRYAFAIALAIVAFGCNAPTQYPESNHMGGDETELAPRKVVGSGFISQLAVGWWDVDKGGDYAYAAVTDGSSGGKNQPTISIQVPQLPPHIPGFLPLGAVADGYVQDLKKRYPDQKVVEKSMIKVDGSDARRIVSSFQNNGKPSRELAVLTVHGDHVYAITGNCDAPAFDKTKTAFDLLVESFRWTPS
jgi:hypothetical protein